MIQRGIYTLGITLSLGMMSYAASAQYPEAPIRLIVPYPPGTGTDNMARYTAQRLSEQLSQTVVVENRAGGNAIIATNAVKVAKPDGHTLLFAANGPVSTNVALYNELPYDPVKDLAPIARLAYGPMGLFVPENSPYNNAEDLFKAIRTNPGKLNYGSGSATYQIAGLWLMSLVGGQVNVISYKGAAPALTDLASGFVDFVIADYSGAQSLLASNKIKILAATTDQRIASQPAIPTLQELGYKDFMQVAWWGVFAPKDTPTTVISTLENALSTSFNDEKSADYMQKMNYVNYYAPAETLLHFLQSEIKRESDLVNQFNIPKL